MQFSSIVDETAAFVKQQLAGAEGGHDWFHTERVWNIAKFLQAAEGGNLFVIELAALLHDIADPKFHHGNEHLALQISGDFLLSKNLPQHLISEVLFIIKNISFKNREEASSDINLELMIVQDADRLDALGAIGIARAFNFGGFKNNLMHDPSQPPRTAMNKEEYKKSRGTTINHFYEKLLLLKDLMHTETARKLAIERHQTILGFLRDFYFEWNFGTGAK